MIKRVLTLFLALTLVLCIPSPTFSSEISVDSLKDMLNAFPLGDEARKKPLIELAEYFIYLDPKKTEQYATEVLALPINVNDNHIFRAQALRLLGHAQMYQGLNQKAFAHLNQAITSANQTQSNHLISVAYRVMGVFYELTLDHDNALKYYIEALKFAKKSSFKEDSAMVYNNLGNVLNSQNDYENATKYFEQSITLNTELNDIPMKMNASVGLSVSLLKLGKLSEAKALLKDVIKNRALISDFSFSEASVNLAHVYKLLKDFPAAESLYKFVINDEQGGSYLPAVASAYLGLADLLTQTNQIAAATALYKQGIIEVKDKISLESEMELYEHLAKLELSQENFKAASKIQSQYIERRNQVQPLIPTGIIQKLEDQLKMERDYRILQEELLVSQRESLNSSLYLFAVIVFSLLSLVLFLVLMIRKQVIERLEARNKTLKKASETDPLTGIGNRRFLDHKINAFQGQDISMAFLLLDIDHFKEINDNFGHDVGDNILVVIAETIKKLCRKDDLFARIGGEEFVILTFSNNEESATLFAERIRTTIEGMSRSFESTVTASIGIALGNMKAANYDELYKQADIALYSAKNQGRNKVLLYSKEDSTIEQG